MHVNRILHAEQLLAVLRTMLINRPVEILRIIPQIGRNRISWIYIENQITKCRTASFISFQDLLDAFWIWLETAEVMLMALYQRMAISEILFAQVQVGDTIYSSQYGWVEILEKDRTERLNLPRFWIDAGTSLEKVEPWEVKP